MKRFVSVIGPNKQKCTEQLYAFGLQLGEFIVNHQWGIVCGGKFGFMEAVCKGARRSSFYDGASTIGIIPEETKESANSYVDIVIPTGLSFSRNNLVVRPGEFVIAAGGGAGTLSEIAIAWQIGKRIVCFSQYGGWSSELAGVALDTLGDAIVGICALEELEPFLV